MATLNTTVHVSPSPYVTSTFTRSLSSNLTQKANNLSRARCALSPLKWREKKQVAEYASDAGNGKTAFNDVDQCLRALEELDSLLLRASINDSKASVKSMKAGVGTALNALDRKKLDPLEVYVPAVILTQLQIKDLDRTLELDQPRYDTCRSLLRSVSAASCKYSSTLEVLLCASRNDSKASVKSVKAEVGTALNALDSLLQTIPLLVKVKAIAEAYRTPEENAEAEILDPEIKQLESIL